MDRLEGEMVLIDTVNTPILPARPCLPVCDNSSVRFCAEKAESRQQANVIIIDLHHKYGFPLSRLISVGMEPIASLNTKELVVMRTQRNHPDHVIVGSADVCHSAKCHKHENQSPHRTPSLLVGFETVASEGWY
jgi:hypothetical protein